MLDSYSVTLKSPQQPAVLNLVKQSQHSQWSTWSQTNLQASPGSRLVMKN